MPTAGCHFAGWFEADSGGQSISFGTLKACAQNHCADIGDSKLSHAGKATLAMCVLALVTSLISLVCAGLRAAEVGPDVVKYGIGLGAGLTVTFTFIGIILFLSFVHWSRRLIGPRCAALVVYSVVSAQRVKALVGKKPSPDWAWAMCLVSSSISMIVNCSVCFIRDKL
jgi:hypothetical protein